MQILKAIPKRCQDPVLWAWLGITLPLRGTDSKTKLYLSCHIHFQLNTLKGTAKAPAVDLRMNTLESAVTTFLTPKRKNKQPRSFHTAVPSPWGYADAALEINEREEHAVIQPLVAAKTACLGNHSQTNIKISGFSLACKVDS